ncbi:MAG: hypothetical protein C4526_01270 [Nitrospiraceae bacterium]|nr:MAG: hypothetical protein C4526_01270 [Nitrospiraceae bacterium]
MWLSILIGFLMSDTINSKIKYNKVNWVRPVRIAIFVLGGIFFLTLIDLLFRLILAPSIFLKTIKDNHNWVDLLITVGVTILMVVCSSLLSKNNLRIEIQKILSCDWSDSQR